MKQFFIGFVAILLTNLFMTDTNGQNNDKKYTALWKEVEKLGEEQRLPESALKKVKEIYALAKRENNEAQLVKALLGITQLRVENTEENEKLSLKDIETELATGSPVVKALLNSYMAGIYHNYFERNRWQIYGRTATVNFVKEDLATWSATDFHKKVSDLYLLSLKDEAVLWQTKVEAIEPLLYKGNMRFLRPTLYDLLAHKALDYFENNERDIAKPAYAFKIDQAAAFDPAADFVHRKFVTNDSLSLQHKALLIYQQLIAFHLKDTKHDALIDVDLKRLAFVKNYAVHPDKNQLYFHAVNHIANQYGQLPAAAQAWYLVAIHYNELGEGYKPHGDTTNRYAKIKAKEICEKIVAQKDSSEGRVNAYNLLNQLKAQSLNFSVEKVNVPSLPFRSLVKYTNLAQLHLRLIKVDEALAKKMDNKYGDDFWKIVLEQPAIKNWEQTVPDTKDLQEHAAEVKVDGLPVGKYMLLMSSNKQFTNKTAVLGGRVLYVSNISYVNDNEDYFVLNRQTGQPLLNAKVQVWENKYDYTTQKYIRTKGKLLTTDKQGYAKLDNEPEKNESRYTNHAKFLEITHATDKLLIDEPEYSNYYYSNNIAETPKENIQAYFFTDRSIYRPGQSVQFKGILLARYTNETKSRIKEGYKTTVWLKNANHERVDSLKLTTNEYGSLSGTFQLPSGGLNGSFMIEVSGNDISGSSNFRVEEYKRPKFFVEYEPVKGSFKVNDVILVKGNAKAYAGNNIDGATVSYRVVREARFPYPWMFRRWWMPVSDNMEITNGVTTTDADGRFTVQFNAIPDESIDKKFDPQFQYTVYADVTDINGETRSGQQQVTVGYAALLLQASIPERLLLDSLKTLSIGTTNSNGEFEKATVTVTAAKLTEENRLIRDRFWERPDQFVYNKEQYVQWFPYDEYDNETARETWAKGKTLLEATAATQDNGLFTVDRKKLVPGFYELVITTTDKYGTPVKDVKYVELYDNKTNKLTSPVYLWSQAAGAVEPGETATVGIGTTADKVYLIEQLKKNTNNKVTATYTFGQMDNEKQYNKFTPAENDRGGYGVSWLFVKHNRVYQYTQVIVVPWTNKELAIEYGTHRDKTLPGSEEKWSVKIKGLKQDKVAAEFLAGMYDASLDQFNPHAWYQPYVWLNFYNNSQWNYNKNFQGVYAQIRYAQGVDGKYLQKDYDQLFDVINDYRGYMGGASGAGMQLRIRGKASGVYEDAKSAKEVMAAAPSVKVMQDGTIDGLSNQFARNEMEFSSDSVAYNMTTEKKEPATDIPSPRKNFNETAFFFPQLRTDADGSVSFSFTLPEALTQWKFQGLAHTKDLAFGYSTTSIVTQKQLMVQPNPTRFLREGDQMTFSGKVVNVSEQTLSGEAYLELLDAATGLPVNDLFKNQTGNIKFSLEAGKSIAVNFPIQIPAAFNKAITWRIIAKAQGKTAADSYSDGEENSLPVLTNKILVTESLPLSLRENSKKFTFTNLLQSNTSKTLVNQGITVEYTANPAWYAVQALPYLMEYPYDCAEQTWNRYYANSIASSLVNSSEKIKKVFESWQIKDTAALLSNLQKNEELKAILLEETPWVLAAKSEAEQKRNIALLFDLVRMGKELTGAIEKLKQLQSSNGGFVWFKGGPDNRYMTQYILTGMGHLNKISAVAKFQQASLNQIAAAAIPYLDNKMKADYDDLVKWKTDLKTYVPSYQVIQYLYMRSFYSGIKMPEAAQKAYNYFLQQATTTWAKQNKYMQGMIVLALGRKGDKVTPQAILKSLKETAVKNDELGMYWKDASRSWWWYESPIERQALLIEAFQEIGKDAATVDALRTWLLKNKQTNNWETTKATAEACYALLIQGTDWLSDEPKVQINLGNSYTIRSADLAQQAGTGYFKTTIPGEQVKADMGNITVQVTPAKGEQAKTTWGAVYWQYFENMDKIKTAATPLQLTKKLFVSTNSDRGPVLNPVNEGDVLKVGSKIVVRIELRVDRDMEYVHMKDMRAAALEPTNVLSSYKWQGGLGYYETTKDASTNFFFDQLRKGTYVFEYSLFVTHAGEFSNGITTIQCMYAPEFTSHSEGVRIKVQ
jgi:uncharacterized protein YfaS (alpha-2-macroglobulin family)